MNKSITSVVQGVVVAVEGIAVVVAVEGIVVVVVL